MRKSRRAPERRFGLGTILNARGKGQALAWALERVRAERSGTEAVIVVDADCIASPNLCAVVADELADPEIQAVQARYEVSNADESPTAALRAAGFILKHVIRSKGRGRAGPLVRSVRIGYGVPHRFVRPRAMADVGD